MICVLFFLDYALSFKCNLRSGLGFAIHVTCFANESQDGRYNHLGMTDDCGDVLKVKAASVVLLPRASHLCCFWIQ